MAKIYGKIVNCGNRINVTASDCSVGGITGRNVGGNISGCFNTGDVSGNGTTGESHAGGILGTAVGGGQVSDCYNKGNVSASQKYSGGIIGAIGLNESIQLNILNCFNVGTITGNTWFGSLVGCGPVCVSFEKCFYSGNKWYGYSRRKLVKRRH